MGENKGSFSRFTMVLLVTLILLTWAAILEAQTIYYVSPVGNGTPPFNSWGTAATNIQDAIDAASAGDTVLVTNGTYATGSHTVHGAITNRVAVTKPLTLRSVNGPMVTCIQGFQMPVTVTGPGAVRCVYLTNGTSLIGFTLTNGATLAIGDLDSERSGGGVWAESTSSVVSNCILAGNRAFRAAGAYGATLISCTLTSNLAVRAGGAHGATLINCTLTSNSAVDPGLVSRAGAAEYCTLINCSLTNNWAGAAGAAEYCTLTNCTLTANTAASPSGEGGAACNSTLDNCLIIGNSSAAYGGGISWSVLNNCALTNNSAVTSGGGSYYGTLSNCTLVANSSARYGGGAFYGTAKNCILYSNTATNGSNYYATSLSYCCTTPASTGPGNFTNAPLFVEVAGWNLRLSSQSSCINAGNNLFAPGAVDLDGRPRLVGNTVDIGAYEFQSADTNAYLTWLIQNGLPPTLSSDSADLDEDGMNNWQEWLADTCPTNAKAALRVQVATGPSLSPPITLTFMGSPNRSYTLFRCTSLSGGSWVNVPGQTDITGVGGPQTLTDTSPGTVGFYRVGVKAP